MVRVRSRSPTVIEHGSSMLFSRPMTMCIVAVVVTIGIITVVTTQQTQLPPSMDVLQKLSPMVVSSRASVGSSSPLIRGTTSGGMDRTSSSSSSSSTSSSSSSSLALFDTDESRQNQPSSYYESTNDDQCHYYLAESAIPMSGLGLFTTHSIAKGDMSQSMADICIYVADTPKRDYTHFETHSWSRDAWLGMYEGNNPRAACEGFATLFNTMPPGVQTSRLYMEHTPNNVNLDRTVDVNAGAVTQYDGISSITTRDVPAGSEITIDYEDFHYDKNTKYVAPTRSVEWIRRHGMCIDNIRIDTATEPKMGRGAFAKRTMISGTRIAPAPIQIFHNRSVFVKAQQEATKKLGKQQQKELPVEPLLLNYCFTIDDPNDKEGLLLFPYGPGVSLINHSHKNPNVKLEWSYHPMHHNTWLDLPYYQYKTMDYPGGLILDVVALRDIQEGEELFMNYGDEWQTAWEEHVKTWKPYTLPNKTYVYPQDMDLTKPFRTLQELETEPYASNLQTACWTNNWPIKETSNKLKWTKPKKFFWPEGITYCNVLSRTELSAGTYEYEVSLHYESDKPGTDTNYIDTNVPQSSIFFVELPYTSDLHLPNAFRFPMQLPSHLIPPQWTSLKRRTTETSKTVRKVK